MSGSIPTAVGTTVTEADLARYVAALVVADDVSARQIQLTKTQFYESKSHPTFTPVGPWLTLVDAADLARLGSLRLTLSVNGQVRQDNTVAADMLVRPAQALTLLSRFQPMAPGDLLLTGTPGGTALKAPAKIAGLLAALLPPATRWKLFFNREAANPRYLHDGDVITATIASPDGQLDLGTQHNTIIGNPLDAGFSSAQPPIRRPRTHTLLSAGCSILRPGSSGRFSMTLSIRPKSLAISAVRNISRSRASSIFFSG